MFSCQAERKYVEYSNKQMSKSFHTCKKFHVKSTIFSKSRFKTKNRFFYKKYKILTDK